MPTLEEMFSTTKDPMQRGERLEGLKKSLDESVERWRLIAQATKAMTKTDQENS